MASFGIILIDQQDLSFSAKTSPTLNFSWFKNDSIILSNASSLSLSTSLQQGLLSIKIDLIQQAFKSVWSVTKIITVALISVITKLIL